MFRFLRWWWENWEDNDTVLVIVLTILISTYIIGSLHGR